jgi:beta-lactamase regulating signal transducer with metallopeptidase domain
MDPSLGLLAASGLVNFLLKTTAEWLVCLVLVRITRSARTRFNLWLTMLLGFVAQWVWMWTRILRAAFPATSVTGPASGVTAHAARITVAETLAGTVAQAMGVLLVCYIAVLAWRMLGTLAARVRLTRAMRHKCAPDGMLANSFQEALEQTAGYGAKLQDCELWVLPGLPSPATLGWWQPRVIVPPVCRTQDAAELKVVFWHELMHVERRDALWNAVVRACRNVLWFHPCVHHAINALGAQRELACDEAVVREHPQSRDVYATCLVRFARARDLSPEPSVAGIEMASNTALLTTRVRSILSEAQRTSRLSIALRATASLTLVGVMAATVPALNILFAEAVIGPAMRIPVVSEVHPVDKRQAVRSGNTKVQGAALMQTAGVAAPVAVSLAMQHDESLAAEHRAGMDVLTESTGMDIGGAGETRVAGLSGTTPGHGAGGQSPSTWTSVAVNAVERMRPLMNDHDADDRH